MFREIITLKKADGVVKKWFFLCIFLLNGCVANDKGNIPGYRQIVPLTVKYLARTFIIQTDIEALKQRNILRIEKMNNVKFKAKYAQAYAILKKLPQSLLNKYFIREHASKEEIITRIRVLTKDDFLDVVDAIPDDFIIDSFEEYFRNKENIIGFNIVESLNRIWKSIIRKA